QSVALPLIHYISAAPKCISGSTSYFRVCLAFHPYPQVIRRLFNVNRFGPPFGVTQTSTCPWVDHTVSRLPLLTKRINTLSFPKNESRPIQTRFRFGCVT